MTKERLERNLRIVQEDAPEEEPEQQRTFYEQMITFLLRTTMVTGLIAVILLASAISVYILIFALGGARMTPPTITGVVFFAAGLYCGWRLCAAYIHERFRHIGQAVIEKVFSEKEESTQE